MNPKISVVMPVWNGEKYLAEAIKSVLDQTLREFEFIIVNDGSTDATEEIIQTFADPRIVYLKNEANLGLSKSFNKGIAAATGEYLARMDADDIALPERFAKEAAFLDSHPEIGVVGSAVWRIDEKGAKLGLSRKALEPQALKWQSLFSTPLFHPAVMARAEVLKENPFDESLASSEDYELWSRLMFERGVKLANLPEPLLMYRVFPGSFTKSLTPEKRRNSINNSLANIERYAALTPADKKLLTEAFMGKPSLAESLAILKLYRRIRQEFIARESFIPSLRPFILGLAKRILR